MSERRYRLCEVVERPDRDDDLVISARMAIVLSLARVVISINRIFDNCNSIFLISINRPMDINK